MNGNKLLELAQKAIELNNEMEKSIIEFVNENGGVIRTLDDNKDAIYCYKANWDWTSAEEERVCAVATFYNGKVLGLLVGMIEEDMEAIDDDTLCEVGDWILLDRENTSNVVMNATLSTLCDYLPYYVKED